MNTKFLAISIAISAASLFASSAAADTFEGTLYLMNGSTVTGIITEQEEDSQITIETNEGHVYHYTRSQIRKIDTSTHVVTPTVGKYTPAEGDYVNSGRRDKGFWCAAEAVSGVSGRIIGKNFGYEEIDLVGGYRFNEYVRVGLGVGARWYWNNRSVRYDKAAWTGPLFINVRGEFMRRAQRTVVPMYSFDIGGTFRDGFMIRPGIGIRVGELRSAFTLTLCYTGQGLDRKAWNLQGEVVKKSAFISFVALKLGYEF